MKKKWLIALVAAAVAAATVVLPPAAPILQAVGAILVGLPEPVDAVPPLDPVRVKSGW